jgi:hypothetical protein
MIFNKDTVIDWVQENPNNNGISWYGLCGAVMFNLCFKFGVVPNPVPATAKEASKAAVPLNKDFLKAPIGAFHYWDIGTEGHVGVDASGGGLEIFMASHYLAQKLNADLGFQSAVGYSRGVYPYLGWSLTYGKNGRVVNQIPVVTYNEAEKWAIDNKIVNLPVDFSKPITYEIACWLIYKSRGKT